MDTCLDGLIYGKLNGETDGWTDAQGDGKKGRLMDGWMWG